MYTPGEIPQDASALPGYLAEELGKLASLLEAMQVPRVQLVELHSAPVRPREGLVVFADGTNWNPGAGRGVYVYSSAAWVKL